MYIHGQFDNLYGVRYTVHITDGNAFQEKIIGENGLYFGADPINIQQDVSDTFEHVIKKSATINLITSEYIGNYLFAVEPRDIKVYITRTVYNGSSITEECVFAGFVEPATFNQPYFDVADEFTLNCIDGLSTLQYYNYKNATVRNFDSLKLTVDDVSFRSILNDALSGITSFNQTPSSTIGSYVLYDMSKGTEEGEEMNVFEQLSVNDGILLGDTIDDTMTKEATLTEILKYLNLHIVQQGTNYYIFDWNTIKNGGPNVYQTWVNLITQQTIVRESNQIEINKDLNGGTDTNITMAEVYNSIQVKDDIVNQDVIIESPLDDDIVNVTPKKLYMTQYWIGDVGENWGDFGPKMVNWVYFIYALLYGTSFDYLEDNRSRVEMKDFYCQFARSKNWEFKLSNGESVDTLYDEDPLEILKYQKEHSLTPQIIKFGHITYDVYAKRKDSSPLSTLNMTPYICISLNGNQNDTEEGHSPSDEDLRGTEGFIEYVGNTSAGYYSPVDSETTNYLVFSGKMMLQGICHDSAPYTELLDKINAHADYVTSIMVDGGWATRKWYTTDGLIVNSGYNDPEARQSQALQYNYSYISDRWDHVNKLPLLQCELTIGNKRLVETNIDELGNSEMGWYTIGEEPIVDGVRQTTFSLGVNPARGDMIIGKEYDIQNTITLDMNLDDKGTAIPIRKEDNLHGAMHFRILGPYNAVWNEINQQASVAATWWWINPQSTWTENMRYCLAHAENLLLKEFKCKLVTSSKDSLNNSNENNDLIYCSAESNKSALKGKDDITFKYITQLSTAEALEKGISPQVAVNTVINGDAPLTGLYNATTQETAKAEEHYVDNYYREYCTPKIILENDMIVKGFDTLKWDSKYHDHHLNKTFYVMGYTLNAETDTKHFKLKEL